MIFCGVLWDFEEFSVVSALKSMRIRIQLFTSMRIWIRGAKLTRIHADPDPGQIFAFTKS
jgi:hypothetical protein